jgi:drug/metabolite transporter, DME family
VLEGFEKAHDVRFRAAVAKLVPGLFDLAEVFAEFRVRLFEVVSCVGKAFGHSSTLHVARFVDWWLKRMCGATPTLDKNGNGMSVGHESSRAGSTNTASLVGLGAGVVWSLGALASRMADGSSAWQYLIWRSIAIVVVIEVMSAFQGKKSPLVRAYTEGWLMLACCGSLFLASVGFVYAIKNTTAANAAFMASLSPMIAAVLGRVFLGERLNRITGAAIALSLVGLSVMVIADAKGGNLRGNIGALSSSFGFACYTLCLRADRKRNWDPVMPGYAVFMIAICVIVTTIQGRSVVPPAKDIVLAMIHGGVLIVVGTLMYNAASKRVPAVAMTVFAQTEMVFIPLWIFLKFNERPKSQTIIGGLIILSAIVGKAVFDSKDSELAVGQPT